MVDSKGAPQLSQEIIAETNKLTDAEMEEMA